jgi:hypothetical protein
LRRHKKADPSDQLKCLILFRNNDLDGNELNPPAKTQTFSAVAGTQIDAAAVAMTVPHQRWIDNNSFSRCLCRVCVVTPWCIHLGHPIKLHFEDAGFTALTQRQRFVRNRESELSEGDQPFHPPPSALNKSMEATRSAN